MIKKELSVFVMVGVTTVLIDFIVYNALVEFRLSDVNMAKGIGFVSGTIFSYFMHKIWTFGHKKHESGTVWRYVLLYMSTLWVNVSINAFVLNVIYEFKYIILLAFLIATGASTILNFIGMKWFVFKESSVLKETS
jgi:putative flippase GtrA